MEEFKAGYALVTEIRSADPAKYHPGQQIYCGAAELSLRNVGLSVFVASIEDIRTFSYQEIRGILDMCVCCIDWSSVKFQDKADYRAAQNLQKRAAGKKGEVGQVLDRLR
eukprot:9157319-Lingulodinium_polyedra.AAC.1